MVQYPMCPRPPQPYVAQAPGVAEKVEAEGSVNAADTGSPKQLPQAPKAEQPVTKSPERPAPVSKPVGEKVVERLLMPPPPPPVFTAPAPLLQLLNANEQETPNPLQLLSPPLLHRVIKMKSRERKQKCPWMHLVWCPMEATPPMKRRRRLIATRRDPPSTDLIFTIVF
ncbi:hypothetical protein NL108_006878 [Boleophthalmus pectinirostris]|nr:hypothetical protein NL108_006878 [Boleophthalmus pectinirostris]